MSHLNYRKKTIIRTSSASGKNKTEDGDRISVSQVAIHCKSVRTCCTMRLLPRPRILKNAAAHSRAPTVTNPRSPPPAKQRQETPEFKITTIRYIEHGCHCYNYYVAGVPNKSIAPYSCELNSEHDIVPYHCQYHYCCLAQMHHLPCEHPWPRPRP